MKLPLQGVMVLEFSQYLAGPYAGLRLSDLGARVIKIERPNTGDACRALATKNQWADGDSVLFHTINRGKESFTADLKQPEGVLAVRKLIARADIVTHNFRPGIMEKIGFDYESVKDIKPDIVYGEVSGYGHVGPWKHKPGQDLLAQSLSGLMWMSNNADAPPTPFGIAVADMLCGTHLAQGLLAALVRKKRQGQGGKVSVSLLESILDFQFEGLTAFLNSGDLPERSVKHNAHPYMAAPYGIYDTADGAIAISMGSLEQLCQAIGCAGLEQYYDKRAMFTHRDFIKAHLSLHFRVHPTAYWQKQLSDHGYWHAPVLDYNSLTHQDAFRVLNMVQKLDQGRPVSLYTTRCPIRFNRKARFNSQLAPVLGAHTHTLSEEFGL